MNTDNIRADDNDSLAQRIDAILAPLGGRTACAARRFDHAPARSLPMASHSHEHHGDHDHDAASTNLPPAAAQEERSILLRTDEAFPAASLAKLPIAVELLRRVDLGQFDLAERWDTAAEPRAGGGGVLDVLDPTTRLTLGDLCALMLIVSDNTAANFLLGLVGMGEVNESMSRLNLSHTRLARQFMDVAARAARRDNLTSAGDMLALLTLIRGGALPGARRLRETLAAQLSFAELAEGWLPAGAQLAHKDGTLDDTAHDAGLLTGPGGACAYCLLTTEQRDIPAARAAVGRVVRLLWDAWCAG
jgi:beta-lactamase class A